MGRATAREWRRPVPLPSRAKTHPIVNQSPEDEGKRSITQGGIVRDRSDTEVLTTVKKP